MIDKTSEKPPWTIETLGWKVEELDHKYWDLAEDNVRNINKIKELETKIELLKRDVLWATTKARWLECELRKRTTTLRSEVQGEIKQVG